MLAPNQRVCWAVRLEGHFWEGWSIGLLANSTREPQSNEAVFELPAHAIFNASYTALECSCWPYSLLTSGLIGQGSPTERSTVLHGPARAQVLKLSVNQLSGTISEGWQLPRSLQVLVTYWLVIGVLPAPWHMARR